MTIAVMTPPPKPMSGLTTSPAISIETTPSPKLGQHNAAIYGDWLGLSDVEITELKNDGAI